LRRSVPDKEAGSAGLLLSEDAALTTRPPRLLDRLPPQDRAVLLEHGQPLDVVAGAAVFTQGEPHRGIFLVESGRVRVFYAAPEGRELTLAYWFPGNFVGGPEIWGESPHVWSAVAVQPSRLLFLPALILRRLVPEMPSLAVALIENLVFKGKCYSALAQMLGTRSVSERLPLLLRHLVSLYGEPAPDGIRIAASLTHEELARLVGASRQWVTASLRRMEEAQIISVTRNAITVRVLERLG
jgi:CRP/FNR family transcriptional regulator, cyclic AMP receptor protein